MGDTIRGSSTAIPRIAAQKLCGFRAEFPRISSDFVKFLLTSTVFVQYMYICITVFSPDYYCTVRICTVYVRMYYSVLARILK